MAVMVLPGMAVGVGALLIGTAMGKASYSVATRLVTEYTGTTGHELGVPEEKAAHLATRVSTGVVCAVVCLLCTMRFGMGLQALEIMALTGIFSTLSLTDFAARFIPNRCIVALFVVRLMFFLLRGCEGEPYASAVVDSLLGVLALVIPLGLMMLGMDHLLGRPSMGGGDLKLFAAAGFLCGWQVCVPLVMLSCALGIMLWAILHRWSRMHVAGTGSDVVAVHSFPFGPAIALASLSMMLYGDVLISWYESLLL